MSEGYYSDLDKEKENYDSDVDYGFDSEFEFDAPADDGTPNMVFTNELQKNIFSDFGLDLKRTYREMEIYKNNYSPFFTDSYVFLDSIKYNIFDEFRELLFSSKIPKSDVETIAIHIIYKDNIDMFDLLIQKYKNVIMTSRKVIIKAFDYNSTKIIEYLKNNDIIKSEFFSEEDLEKISKYVDTRKPTEYKNIKDEVLFELHEEYNKRYKYIEDFDLFKAYRYVWEHDKRCNEYLNFETIKNKLLEKKNSKNIRIDHLYENFHWFAIYYVASENDLLDKNLTREECEWFLTFLLENCRTTEDPDTFRYLFGLKFFEISESKLDECVELITKARIDRYMYRYITGHPKKYVFKLLTYMFMYSRKVAIMFKPIYRKYRDPNFENKKLRYTYRKIYTYVVRAYGWYLFDDEWFAEETIDDKEVYEKLETMKIDKESKKSGKMGENVKKYRKSMVNYSQRDSKRLKCLL